VLTHACIRLPEAVYMQLLPFGVVPIAKVIRSCVWHAHFSCPSEMFNACPQSEGRGKNHLVPVFLRIT